MPVSGDRLGNLTSTSPLHLTSPPRHLPFVCLQILLPSMSTVVNKGNIYHSNEFSTLQAGLDDWPQQIINDSMCPPSGRVANWRLWEVVSLPSFPRNIR